MNDSISFLATTITLVHIFFMIGFSVSVYTIHSPDGDLIDCISIYDQPAFKDHLLKNHELQEFPTDMPKLEKERKNWQVWHTIGKTCPAKTIPIRRDSGDKGISHRKYPKVKEVAVKITQGHKYAVGYKENREKIYGTRATLNVWDPIVETADDFSLAQIWLASGSYKTADVNTVEAGWQVSPEKYLDHQPRLFTYWTRDAYNITGCYNTNCSGFVHTSSRIALGAAIIRTSKSMYNGLILFYWKELTFFPHYSWSKFEAPQFDITLQIWKDQVTGHWWLGIGLIDVEPIGYWPRTIFTTLSDYAQTVEWGGEVLYRNSSGMNPIVQMGSGEFADKGFGRAAYVCNIQVAENNQTLLPVQDFDVRADFPNYYTIKKSHNRECGKHFYYGGPGPMQSSAALLGRSFNFIILLVVFWFFF